MEEIRVLRNKLSNAPHKSERVLVSEARLAIPRMLRIPKRITLAVVLPPEDPKDKLHSLINLATRLLSSCLHNPLILSLFRSARRHGRVDSLLHILMRHAETQDRNEGGEPLVAALGGFEDLLHFVEDGRDGGFLDTRKEEFELPVGHARGGELLDSVLGVMQVGEDMDVFVGDGEGVAHDEGDDDETEDFSQEIALVFALALDFAHQLEQLLLEVVVILHPSQSAKCIDMVLNNVLDVLLVPFLLICVDLDHAQWRAPPFHQSSLVRCWIGDVLPRNEKLLVEGRELVHLD